MPSIFEKKPVVLTEDEKRAALRRLGDRASGLREKLGELKKPFVILMRVVNARLDYSYDHPPLGGNTEEPGLVDLVLSNALIEAVRDFDLGYRTFATTTVVRSDGRKIEYNRVVEIDWGKRQILTSFAENAEEGDAFLNAMSVVVLELQKKSEAATAKIPKN